MSKLDVPVLCPHLHLLLLLLLLLLNLLCLMFQCCVTYLSICHVYLLQSYCVLSDKRPTQSNTGVNYHVTHIDRKSVV